MSPLEYSRRIWNLLA